MDRLTPAQFQALAQLLRLRPGSDSYRCAQLVFVDGMSIGDAARESGISYKRAHAAIQRVDRGLDLAREINSP